MEASLRRFETPLGPVVFHGRDTGRPKHLVICSAFAPASQLVHAQAALPEVDVWRTQLPGNHVPALVTCSIGAFAFAFSHALRQVLAGDRAAVTGISAGALVALALDPALVSGLVLAEPPLRPWLAWPFRFVHDRAKPEDRDFIWRIFGVGDGVTEARDYTPLLARLASPATVLVGEEPLGQPRALAEIPSVVDDHSRALLAAHPGVELVVVPGCGHKVHEGPEILAAMRRAGA